MAIQLNNNAFDQSTADRDHIRQTAALAAIMAHSSEQSFDLRWPEKSQAESRERIKKAAVAHSSIHLPLELAGSLMGSCLAFECKALPPSAQAELRTGQKTSSAPGGAAEQTALEVTRRVVLSLMEREQITSARKALDALPVGELGDPTIIRLRKMLALPIAKTSGKRDLDRTLDYQWIRDHAQDYRGQWVALENGQLLGAAASLRELLDRVNPLQSQHRPLVHQIH
jgi:hypothetical protein